MKKSNVLLVFAGSILALASCGGATSSLIPSSSQTPTSSNTTSDWATSSSKGDATSSKTESSIPSSSSEASSNSSSEAPSSSSSSEQSSSSSNSSSQQPPLVPEISWTTEWPATTYIGDASIVLKAAVSNLSEGTTATISYSLSAGAGATGTNISDYAEDTNAKYLNLGPRAGYFTVTAKTTIGGVDYTVSKDVSLLVSEVNGVGISTPDELENLLKGNGVNQSIYLKNSIDMSGVDFDGTAINATFVGSIDGKGYSITNLVIDSSNHMNAAMFRTFNGSIINTRIDATMNATAWSGIVGGNIGETANIQNCLFNCDFEGSAETAGWQFNGAIGGVVTGATVIDNVINVSGTYVAQHFAITAYMNGSPTISNNYTNALQNPTPFANTDTRNADRVSPLNATESGQGWVSEFNLADKVYGGLTLASATYNLDESVWTLAAGASPVLKNDAATPVKADPSVALTSDVDYVDVNGTLVVTATAKHITGEVTYAFSTAETTIISLAQGETDKSQVTVTGLVIGTATLKVEVSQSGAVIATGTKALTVKAAGPVGEEITTAAQISSIFDGGAAYTAKDFYLGNDIDCSTVSFARISMAGEFAATFDGNGHVLTNCAIKNSMFNIIGTKGSVKNLTISGTCDSDGDGFGAVAYANNGVISTVTLNLTPITARAGAYSAFFFMGSGKISDSSASIHFKKDAKQAAFFLAGAQSGATITNVKGTYYNEADATADEKSSIIPGNGIEATDITDGGTYTA